MRKEGYNQARIAECLGRDPGTISREIRQQQRAEGLSAQTGTEQGARPPFRQPAEGEVHPADASAGGVASAG